jgi:hypothetical protein
VGVSASDAQAPGLFAGCRVLSLYGLIATGCFCMHVIGLVCLCRLWCIFKGDHSGQVHVCSFFLMMCWHL